MGMALGQSSMSLPNPRISTMNNTTKAEPQLWKCLHEDMRSGHGTEAPWTIGEWRTITGPLILCRNGYHASPTVLAAISYVRPGYVCTVEVDGLSEQDTDKSVHERMRIVRAVRWEKADSVGLAVFAAELVIDIHERRKPDDTRLRNAIEAAKAWLREPTEVNRQNAADAADAAAADIYAAVAAAADAASAACAAYAAAYAAARREITAKCEAWIQQRLQEKSVDTSCP